MVWEANLLPTIPHPILHGLRAWKLTVSKSPNRKDVLKAFYSADSSLFLDTVLHQLECLPSHPLAYALQLSHLISTLASYPQPLLVAFLFDDSQPNDAFLRITKVRCLIEFEKSCPDKNKSDTKKAMINFWRNHDYIPFFFSIFVLFICHRRKMGEFSFFERFAFV